MNILILGSGGREHAFATKISRSPKCTKLFVAPGNAGTGQIAVNVPVSVTDFDAIKDLVLKENIKMVIVGPEDPLVTGIQDFFREDNDLRKVMVVGPSRRGAMLEGSKERAKEFMAMYGIPTAAYQSFSHESLGAGKEFLRSLQPPYVLKADGLAAGKGVLILNDILVAEAELENMLSHSKFGKAGEKVVIEEFLDGTELSVFVLTDGKHHITLPSAKDYKRIGEGDTGLNTGGMGAVSPVPFADKEFMEKVEERIVKPTIEGIEKEEIDYKGFIFIGLIKVGEDPYVIEYNVRMGDPETEVVLPRINNDLADVFEKLCQGNLNEVNLEIEEQTAATVMLVSGGYPEKYSKGMEISGLEKIKDSEIFHAGTSSKDGKTVTSGGRVLAITSFGKDYQQALSRSYKNAQKLHFDKMYYRKDIGFDLG